MDIQQFYSKHRGLFQVYFVNKGGWSTEKVRELFSKFGTVAVITQCDNNGFCFVKYDNEADAKACVEGLLHHDEIKLFKAKRQNHEKQNNKKQSYRNQKQPRNNDTDHNSSGIVSSMDSIRDIAELTHLQKLRGLISNTFDTSTEKDFFQKGSKVNKNNTYDENEIPPLLSFEENGSVCGSTTSSSTSSVQKKQKIVPAAEVIVANIDPKYSIHYILHLFEYFNPIAVTFMKTIPNTSIRYCHVYFKSEKHALQIQYKFDRLLLGSRSLIVQQPPKFVERKID